MGATPALERNLPPEIRHLVVVVGGAVAGSEAAAVFAERGLLVVVLEQNPRPYGKIEDGLPRWHVALREQEYARIDANLDRPGVLFVPRTQLGTDVSLRVLLDEWQAAAVVLASGAWRDRRLDLGDLAPYEGRGFAYQNAFVHWFNHDPEPGHTGPRFEPADGAIIIGGGLASIDVAKILSLEVFGRALRARGIDVPLEELERLGVAAVLERNGLTAEALGLRGCTLYYRRGIADMPLAQPPDDPTPEQREKARRASEKVMSLVMKKYLVRLEEHAVAVAPLIEGDRVVGMRFQRSEVRDGRVTLVPGSDFEVRAPLTVSSIGSVPEPIEGLPMRRELYDYADWTTGEISGLPGVYGLGNALTGQGNIKVSRRSARHVAEHVVHRYLGVADEPGPFTTDMAVPARADAARQAERIADDVETRPPIAAEALQAALRGVESRWRAVGFDGDYRAWIERSRRG